MSHLLLISLGPIQDFIDSARRCQDLWFGSWLLSDLARAVARAVSEASGLHNALIFPSSLNNNTQERDAAVANKILVRVPDKQAQRVAKAGQDALTERLNELMKGLFGSSSRLGQHFNRKLAEKQVHDMMEYIWVAVSEGNDYPKAREAAESLLARRKNTRTWGEFPWKEGVGVPKSSLDGVRESVLHESLYEDLTRLERAGREAQASALRQRYGLRGRERLCGVALLKRLGVAPDEDLGDGRERPTFHSTGHIAAAPSLGRLESEPKAQEAWGKLWAAWEAAGVERRYVTVGVGGEARASFTDLAGPDPFELQGTAQPVAVWRSAPRTLAQEGGAGLDASLLFEHENRIREVLDEAAPLEATEEQAPRRDKHIKAIQRATQELLRTIEQGEAHAYYAFLLADGDRMGKALDYAREEALQRRIGTALDEFSLECGKVVAQHGGSLIYAGGDDVLALLPLHTALQCANALRIEFSGALSFLKDEAIHATLERNAQEKGKEPFQMPTLSVGVAIAHHMDSMSEARQWAKEAEKLAKKERNSLAILMHKRSGAVLKVTGSWDEANPLHARLARWVHLLARQDLPDRVAFELEDAVRIWDVKGAEPSEAEQDNLQGSVRALLERAVSRRRKNQGAGNEGVASGHQGELLDLLPVGEDAREAARRLSAELQIARLLLSARDAAFGRIEGRGE